MCVAIGVIIYSVIISIYYFLSVWFTRVENRLYCAQLWIGGHPQSWERGGEASSAELKNWM